MSDDIKSKLDSLRALKSQVGQWKKQAIRERAGKKVPEEKKEEVEEDALESLLKKIGK